MFEFVVRESYETEEAARRLLLETATQELRRIYRPREDGGQPDCEPSGALVAVKGSMLVGTAEYLEKDDHVYVRCVAVHPECRNQGVCRALLRAAEKIAKDHALAALAACAIEETGNVGIFEKLGFTVISRAVAPNHVDPEGGPVIQVDMERKITQPANQADDPTAAPIHRLSGRR